LISVTGYPDRPPVFVGMGIGDQGSGVHAFSAIGYALYHRERTGVGQYIDISMVDALFHQHELNLQAYVLSEGQFIPGPMGSHHALVAPCGVFKGPQGYIVVLVLDRQWPSMAKALGQPDLTNDPRFATGADRGKNHRELVKIIEDWMASQPSDEAVLQVLEEFRIAAAPVLTIPDAVKHPYFKARDMIRQVKDPIMGELTIPGFPLKFSEFPQLPDIQAPMLGQHGEELLRDHLGYSASQLAELRAKGVLVSEQS